MCLMKRQQLWWISIHAPREGSDLFVMLFILHILDISIHAPREGSDGDIIKHLREGDVSIHAPREGSDRHPRRPFGCDCDVSIHAPREGSDRHDSGELDRKRISFNPRSP